MDINTFLAILTIAALILTIAALILSFASLKMAKTSEKTTNASLKAAVESKELTAEMRRSADKRERSLTPVARILSDRSHSMLLRMQKEMGDSNKMGDSKKRVEEFSDFNHQIVCTLGAFSRKFAEAHVDEQKSEESKAQWRRILGFN